MKNMAVLIDANVVLDYLLERHPHFSDAQWLFSCCQNNTVKGYVAFHSISIIWYSLRKYKDIDRRSSLLRLMDFLTVTGAPHEEVVKALLNEDFLDFEDCLQEKCANSVGADYIVTGNIADFTTSTIPAVTAGEMVLMLYRTISESEGDMS